MKFTILKIYVTDLFFNKIRYSLYGIFQIQDFDNGYNWFHEVPDRTEYGTYFFSES